MVDILKEALSDDRIETAFVFGSFAEGEETSDSDVDLLIIGGEVNGLPSGQCSSGADGFQTPLIFDVFAGDRRYSERHKY